MQSLRLSWIFLLLLAWILAVSQSFLGCSTHVHIVQNHVPVCSFVPRHSTNKIAEEEWQPQDLSQVSDAEALLACYAYLKRRKLLENSTWTQHERRQRMKAAARPHFFWEEDLSKIAARLQKQMQGEMIDDYDDDIEDDDDEHRETPLRPYRSNVAADVWSGEFTSFPTDPSPTYKRRSQAAKRTWTDPNFRERWYRSRWSGRDHKEDQDALEEKELENKVRALPTGFLGSPELADMTEEEIEDAIRTYLFSSRQRIESRKKTLATRKAVLQKQMEEVTTRSEPFVNQTKMQLPRDSLFVPDKAAMKEAQRKRSERARKLYAKRLENRSPQKDVAKSYKASSIPPPRKYQPNRATPQDAMLRIQRDLESGILPKAEDVKIIMEPGKLAKRRNVLRQILSEFFDMRGKCVPMRDTNCKDIKDLEFVTKSDISDLGALVIDLIERKNSAEIK